MNPGIGSSGIALRAPLSLMLAAMCGIALLPIAAFAAIGDTSLGAFGQPSVLFFVHLTVIGVLFPAVMGVFYQLGPVAFVAKSLPTTRAYVQGVGYMASAAGFLLSWAFLAAWGWIPVAVTGSSVVVFLAYFFVNAADTAVRRTAGWPTTWFLSGALLQSLVLFGGALTLVWGHVNQWPIDFNRWIGVHAFAGFYGVFVELAIGFGYKLLPMFTLSHLKFQRTPYAVWGGVNGGLLGAYAGLLFGRPDLTALGVAVVAFGVSVFLGDSVRIFRHRLRKKVEWPLRAVYAAWVWIAVGTWGFAAWQVVPTAAPQVLAALFLAVAIGGVGQMIVGYFFKIIPFLIWTDRYGKNGLGLGAPLLQQAVRGEWVKGIVAAWNAAALTMVVGLLTGSTAFADLGAIFLGLAAWTAMHEWWRVISPQGIFPKEVLKEKGGEAGDVIS